MQTPLTPTFTKRSIYELPQKYLAKCIHFLRSTEINSNI
jgi:hypothetical protein